MTQDYWQRQGADKALFPDLAWSRPENKALAGKLLVVGGNQHGFAAPATAFREAEAAGAGVVRMLLPDSLRRYVGKTFTSGELAPTTPSGSLATRALALLLEMAAWADACMLAGDCGRNSETAILFEKFFAKYSGQVTASGDSADYCIATPEIVLHRPETLLVLDFSQAQKLFIASHFPQALTSDMDFLRFIEALHDYTVQHQLMLIVAHLDTIFVAVNGAVSSTKPTESRDLTTVAAHAAVWWMQNPSKPYEALSTGVQELA